LRNYPPKNSRFHLNKYTNASEAMKMHVFEAIERLKQAYGVELGGAGPNSYPRALEKPGWIKLGSAEAADMTRRTRARE
jgi:hypothetical protein